MAWDSKAPFLVTRARLMNASPDAVFAELEEYAAHHSDSHFSYDDKLEEALLRRNDPLINLALAQFCFSRKVAADLYRRTFDAGGDADYSKGLRLALLGNPYVPETGFGGHPFGFLTDEEIVRYLSSDAEDDRSATHVIVTNPGAKRLLAKLYNREKPYDAIPDVKFLQAVYWSYSNLAINDDESNEHGPDMSAWGLQKGIRNLLTVLPADEDGLLTVHTILSFLDPRHTSAFDADPTPLIRRWKEIKLSDKFKERGYGNIHGLPLNEEVACLLASLYGWYSKDQKVVYIGSADSPEKFLRCVHYAHQKMTAKEMQIAFNRDGGAFTLAALNNEQLFWQRDTRAKLEDVMRGRLIHRYRRRCEQINKKHADFDLTPVTENGAALLDDKGASRSEGQKRLSALENRIDTIAKQLDGFEKGLKWILALLVVTILLVLRR